MKQTKSKKLTKEKFLNDLNVAVEEVNQIKSGKRKGILLKDFLKS